MEKIPDKTPTQEDELNNLVQKKKKLESEIDKGQTRLESVGAPYKTRKKIFHMCISDEKVLVLSYVKFCSNIYSYRSSIHEYLGRYNSMACLNLNDVASYIS